MLARLCGSSLGVAKRVNPIIVRRTKAPGTADILVLLDCFRQILADIGRYKKRAVLSMSHGLTTTDFEIAIRDGSTLTFAAYRNAMVSLIQLGNLCYTCTNLDDPNRAMHYEK